jgi:hypothetical protein
MEATIDERGTVTLTVPSAQALVLYEWIRRNEASDVRLDQVGVTDAAERMILWGLCKSLAKVCPGPSSPDYPDRLERARSHFRLGAEVTDLG